MTGLRCWQCRIEPADVTEVRSLAGIIHSIPVWSRGDHEHEHALNPPTPGDLLAAGARAADRVTEAWTDD